MELTDSFASPTSSPANSAVTWFPSSLDETLDSWDAQLLRLSGHSLYQSLAWGRYKRIRGWTPQYFRASAGGRIVGMLQALVRMYPGRTAIVWCPGGPVGELDACIPALRQQLPALIGARALYWRSSFLRVRMKEDESFLRAEGWMRPRSIVGAHMTSVWDLRQDESDLLAGLNRNWRYSLRQAHKANLQVERITDPPVRELAQICRAMHVAKGVRAAVRETEIAALFDALGDRCVLFACRNTAGRLVAFHSCGIFGRRAWELFAATSDEGRQTGASFAVLWSLVLYCRERGITDYDLAGLDPANAPGVADFKRWTGAGDVEWLGEWEWSTSPLLSRIVSLTLRNRSTTALP
jgi:lipid II:glycine glycyltransferase (peptidoglycan interpeptide bridge formation enzyme)